MRDRSPVPPSSSSPVHVRAPDERPGDVSDDAARPFTADKAEKVFTVGIFLYVILRAIPIWRPLQDGSVNPWIFLALDLGTAYPYAKSWPRLFRAIAARKVERIAGWAAVLTGSLLLPYLYVAAVGEDVATWVWGVLGVFLLAGLIGAALRIYRTLGASRG